MPFRFGGGQITVNYSLCKSIRIFPEKFKCHVGDDYVFAKCYHDKSQFSETLASRFCSRSNANQLSSKIHSEIIGNRRGQSLGHYLHNLMSQFVFSTSFA